MDKINECTNQRVDERSLIDSDSITTGLVDNFRYMAIVSDKRNVTRYIKR